MSKEVIAVKQVPVVGPYSQAVEVGGFIFLFRTDPIDPQTGLLAGSDIGQATRRVLDNLILVLAEAGLSLKDIVKTTIYLTDLVDFPVVNDIYATYFVAPFPARATVQVAALPKGAMIEIDAIAVRP